MLAIIIILTNNLQGMLHSKHGKKAPEARETVAILSFTELTAKKLALCI